MAKLLDLAVDFGQVSIGESAARVGVKINRSEGLTISQADRTFVARRLTGKIKAKPIPAGQREDAEQGTFSGMEDAELSGTFDVKSLSVSDQEFGLGLTFNLKDTDIATLAHFAKRSGRLVVTAVADIPEAEKAERKGDDEEDEDDK